LFIFSFLIILLFIDMWSLFNLTFGFKFYFGKKVSKEDLEGSISLVLKLQELKNLGIYRFFTKSLVQNLNKVRNFELRYLMTKRQLR